MTSVDSVPLAARTTPRRLPAPPNSRFHSTDLAVILGSVIVVTTALWVRGGGLGALAEGGSSMWLSLADITGLWAGLAGLGGLALVARPASLERRYGLDRMLGWHRWTGTVLVWATVVHMVASLIAYEGDSGRSLLAGTVHQLIAIQQLDWMISATVATGLMVLVGITSWRRLRRRMSYETWYFLHLLGYLAILLAVGHALVLGSDIAGDTWAIAWWVGLYAVVVWLLVQRRVISLVRSLVRPGLHVSGVRDDGGDLRTITVSGPGLRSLSGRPGQWYRLRFGGRGWWWQTHPYSASAAPSTGGLEFTIAVAGDSSRALAHARLGTRVWLEGPYGVFTRAAAKGRPLLLIGGGSGLAPLRAILQDASATDRPVLLLRARSADDIPYHGEMEALAARSGGHAFHAIGRTAATSGDMFDPDRLRHAIPDLTDRDAFLCGPPGLILAARRGLIRAGLDPRHIHSERYDY